MSIFDEFDKVYDSKAMKEEVKEAATKDKEFAELEPGTYQGYIKDMEVKATKNNAPMLAVQFKITDGPCKNKVMFANFMLNKPFSIHKANEFLRSLESDVTVEFDNYSKYATMVDDILAYTEEHEIDYDIKYSLKDGKYSEYKIIGVFTN